MLERLELSNYKGFRAFEIALGKTTLLVGPNNAGKSTILEALRGCTGMIRHASRWRPKAESDWRRETLRVHELPDDPFGLELQNLRHNFAERETSIRLFLTGDLQVTAVWPQASDQAGFFFLQDGDGRTIDTPSDVRRIFPKIGVVPVLTPFEKEERLLDDDYVERSATTRLASRHFRNHLYRRQEDGTLRAFLDFCAPHLDDIGLAPPIERDDLQLAAFYREEGGQRELYWAGDGIQIFLQLLLHLFREQEAASLILDEPDVYLHPELQRRLMRLLLQVAPQIIVATHSQEMVMEAGSEALAWVDKSRKESIHVPDDARLTEFSDSVGSGFNLGLARALKARAVLFVEGNDDVIIRDVAQTMGLNRLAAGGRLTTLPLGGISRLDRLESLAWLSEAFLGGTVRGLVLLDGDYRPPQRTEQLLQVIRKYGLAGHVWHRKEIESYLMHPGVISRVTGAPKALIQGWLEEAAIEFEDLVRTGMIDRFFKDRADRRDDLRTTTKPALAHFNKFWADDSKRPELLPPKELRHWLNQRLQREGFRTFRFRQLSRAITSGEVPTEMRTVLERIDKLADK